MLSTPITSSSVFDPETDIGIHTRPYYSAKNAVEFKGVFDELVSSRENRQILCSDVGIKSSTLYQKAQDALKFLADNGDPKYAALRSEISMRRKSDRVLLFFKSSIKHIISKGGMIEGSMEDGKVLRTWKDDVVEWLEGAKSGDIYDSRERCKGLVLNTEERTTLTLLLAGVEGCELDLQSDYWRIAR